MRTGKIQIILLTVIMSLRGMAQLATPFDCTTPIILKPILMEMRSKEPPIDYSKHDNKWQDPSNWPALPCVFEIKDCTPREGEHGYDRIAEITFDKPSGHVFRLFVTDGVVMRMEHAEPSGEVHTYRQTIKEVADGLHFKDAEYTRLSRESLLKIYTGECLWLRLPKGRHAAIVHLCSSGNNPQSPIFQGGITFPDKPLSVYFRFKNQDIHGLYITSHRGAKDPLGMGAKDKIIYYIMNRWENGTDAYVTDAVFYDKWSNIELGVHFHQNLGLKQYCIGKRGLPCYIFEWEKDGAKRKRHSREKFEKIMDLYLKNHGIEPPRY